jgi:hypothetical protein
MSSQRSVMQATVLHSCNNSTISGDPDTIAGFVVGNRIVVTTKKGAYHGQRGFVSRFCDNRSPKFMYVILDKEALSRRERRFPVASLRLSRGQNSVFSDTSVPNVNSTVIPKVLPTAVPVQVEINTDMVSTTEYDEATVTDASKGGATVRSYARKVLDAYTTVEAIRESLPTDGDQQSHDLRSQLCHVMNMIHGLTIRSSRN